MVLDCAKKIHQTDGIKGIYKGLVPTLIRESVGLGIYFATYEALIARELKTHPKLTRNDISAWKLCTFGGLSGYYSLDWYLSHRCHQVKVAKPIL